MDKIGVINPNTKEVHYIPYDELGAAMEAGGQFADESQQQKANQLQQIQMQSESSANERIAQPEPEKELTGLKGLGADAVNLLRNAIKNGQSFAFKIPENLEKSGKYIEENPGSSILHNAGQALAGAAETGKSTLNLPYKLLKELGAKKLIPEALAKYNELPFTHIPEDTGVEKALGLQSNPETGDELFRAAPDIAGIAAGGTGLLKSGIKALKAPSKDVLFQRALEQQIRDAKSVHELSEKDIKDLGDSLKKQYSAEFGEKIGAVNPVGLEENINVNKNKLEALKEKASLPEEKVGEIPEKPDTNAIISEKKKMAEDARKSAEEALGVLDHPKLKAGAIVQKAIKDVKKSSSDLYDSARKHYEDKQILADNTKEIQSVTKDLDDLKNADELAPGYGSGTAEQKSLESQLQSLQGEQVKASDIFDLQRTVEKMANDTRKKQYSGVSEIEFKRLGSLAERLDNHADKLATRLEEVGGKEVQGMIKEANKGWKTYKELEKNSVAKPALKKGELPSRAMIDIANTEPGNEFLRALTEAYPELKKHMLAAHVGESSVNKLLKPTSQVKQYLKALPEVEDKVQDLKQAIAGIKEGEVKAQSVKKEYDALVKSMQEAATRQKERQTAIASSEKLKKQNKFLEDAIPKIEGKIKIAQSKGLEHDKLTEQLRKHKEQKADNNHKLNKLKDMILKLSGASAIGHKFGL